jgi:hypothetical protein
MEGKTSGWQDSLLNTRQSKHAMRALTNMRVACCGGTQVVSNWQSISIIAQISTQQTMPLDKK